MGLETSYIVIVVVVAVLLDAALIYWLRRTGRLQTIETQFLQATRSFAVRLSDSWKQLKIRTRSKPWSKFAVDRLLKPQEQASAPLETSSPVALETSSAGTWLTYLEWGIIFLAVTWFCAGFLNFSTSTRLPGNEAEVFQTLDWTLVNSLHTSGQFPLWNPYIRTGIPYVADPMLHVYNPVVTLPVLLFGVRNGFKLAVYFSFLIAALGMWQLGKTLGFKAPARTWVALMYTFAGQPLAHFFQGQYLFVLGFAWIPWIMTGLFLVAHTGRRRYVALTVFALGLLFFSGNAYYSFYVLLAGLIFALVMLPRRQSRWPWIRLDGKLLVIFAALAVLALGLIAIQLFPEVQFWPSIRKDMHVAGSHTLAQIFLDYTSKDPNRPDAYSQLPAREEYYAYIGLAPFLALVFLPLAWRRGDKRAIVFFLLIFLMVLAWVMLDQMPWREFVLGLPVLRQFRHLLRVLVIGSFALILLAGMGLDAFWHVTAGPALAGKVKQPGLLAIVGLLGSTFVIVFIVVSLVDLFQTNAPIARTVDAHQPAYDVMDWLRAYDTSEFYIKHIPTNSWADATIAANLRYFDAWYHFADIRSTNQQINRRPVNASPKYIIQASREPAPAGADVRLIHQLAETDIYQDLDSLPLVFQVPKSRLSQEAGAAPLTAAEVTPLAFDLSGLNRMQLSAQSGDSELLVVLVTQYPGWTVAIDGREVDLQNVGGYLAVDMRPGEHTYTFRFRSTAFLIGMIISLLASGFMLYLLFSDIDLSRENLRRKIRLGAAGFGKAWHGLGPALQRVSDRLGYKGSLDELPGEIQPVSGSPVDAAGEMGLGAAARRWLTASNDLLEAFARAISTEAILWTAVLGIYLITRLVGLTHFPIYFFTDEAAQTVLAGDLVRDHFKNYAGDFLPTYFENGGYYRLGVSVYAQVLPYLLFGKSIEVTRGTSVLITLLGVVALGLILRNHFRLRFWWGGVLLFSLAPAWFLHSRTAFETAEAVSFFAVFIYFYLEYRSGRLNFLYLALLAGALAFYTYSPFQVIMAVCAAGLLLVDWRYHWQHRAVVGRGLLLAGLLAGPYLRFVLTRSQANLGTLAALGSIWVRPVPFSEKLLTFLREYLHGLSPAYWFWPQADSLIRHEMKGYAYIPRLYLPLVGIGFVLSFASFYRNRQDGAEDYRAAAFRTIWIALLAIPFSAALVQVGITRLLAMIVPAVLFASIGLDWLLKQIARRLVPGRVLALVVLVGLAGANLWMLRDALVNGPTWYSDYGMSGLQYGVSQVFPAVQQYLQENPGSRAVISPTWANGTDLLERFMLPESLPVEMGSITGYMDQHKALDSETLFVLPPDEYRLAVESGKFTDVQVVKTLPYPNGQPGFYFVKLRYVPEIDQILAAEREQRHQLQEDDIMLDGQTVHIRYSQLDMGAVDGLFDQNDNSVTRTLEANPYVLELIFPEPRRISGLSVIIGSSEVEITALRYTVPGSEPDRQVIRYKGSVEHPELSWDFDRPLETRVLHLEIKDVHQTEPAHVHIWELKLR